MKIGLTMRCCEAQDYEEERDSIARDWTKFLQQYLADFQWLLLPNLPSEAMKTYVVEWGLGGFILTGGGDPGADPLRDQSEKALLDHAISNRKPVLGICRGFQVIQQYLGGPLAACDSTHLSGTHNVRFSSDLKDLTPGETHAQVNSYHRYGILDKDLAAPLQSVALAGRWVECGAAAEPPLMGMLWHPERGGSDPIRDSKLIRSFFMKALNNQVERTKC